MQNYRPRDRRGGQSRIQGVHVGQETVVVNVKGFTRCRTTRRSGNVHDKIGRPGNSEDRSHGGEGSSNSS